MSECCSNNNVWGSTESNTSGGGGGSMFDDHIISLDATSSVTCQNGGVIQSVGAVNFNENTLNRVTALNAGVSSAFSINKSNVTVDMNTDLFDVKDAGVVRLYVDGGETAVRAPDTTTALDMINDVVGISTTTFGNRFLANTTQTSIKKNTEQLTLNNGKVTSSVPVVLTSTHSAANTDLQFSDSAGTGIYSPFVGSLDLACVGSSVVHMTNSSTSLSNQLIVPPGTVSSPEIRFNDTSNTGIYSSATDNFDITIGGQQSFHMDRNNVSSNSKLLLNNSWPQQTPDSCFETLNPFAASIVGFGSITAQTNLVLSRANGSIVSRTKILNGNNLGNIGARGWIDTGSYGSSSATIGFQASEDYNSSTNRGARIQFSTAQNGVGVTLPRVTIENNGFFGINNTSPAATLDIIGASGTTFKMVDTNQAAGRVMSSSATGVGSWVDPNTLSRFLGFIYYEPAVAAFTTFAFGVTSTKYLINPTTVIADSNGFSNPGTAGRLRYDGTFTKVFRCSITVTGSNNSGGGQRQYYFWPSKNGTPIPGASTTQIIGNNVADFYSVNMSFIVSMNANDFIELYASNETNGNGLRVHSLQITCS